MKEVYRKRGRVVRREGAHLVRVDEAGEAIEQEGVFRARALDEIPELPEPDGDAVQKAAGQIASLLEPPLAIERLIVSEGVVDHQCDNRRWRETSRRVHLSIARPPLRALIDLGDYDVGVVGRVADAFARAGGERDAPRRVRLAAHVGAALMPSLDIEMLQSAAEHDGKGEPVRERRVTAATPPNWFRPSYRLRPQRSWFHLRVMPFGEIDDDLPEAIALLAPAGSGAIRVLCVDTRGPFPTTIHASRVLAGRPTERWYPYAAGCFGAELILYNR